jgi:acetoin utilization deacetylase AcuC-like enzyme
LPKTKEVSFIKIPVFFHPDQLNHKPLFEYAFGDKIMHPETTARAESIMDALNTEPDHFVWHAPTEFPLKLIKSIHNQKMVKAIQAATMLPLDQTFYPSVFPYYRDKSKLDPNNIKHAGAFCFDSGTPLNATTFSAAAWSAACAFDAADAIVEKKARVTYSLCRPPGHHASKDLFGGYCYFNNAAIAARHLRKHFDRVTIVDIDFHHGNGTQVLFDRDPTVLVINIHGDPNTFYPYFTGFASEIGTAAGKGFNINIPLPGGVDAQEYLKQMDERILPEVKKFDPQALIISAGFDTYVADPIGAFCLETHDYTTIGERFKSLDLPTVIVQEGGYEETSLGQNVLALLTGFLN